MKILDDNIMMCCIFSGLLGGAMIVECFSTNVGAFICTYSEYKNRIKNENKN